MQDLLIAYDITVELEILKQPIEGVMPGGRPPELECVVEGDRERGGGSPGGGAPQGTRISVLTAVLD
jgi:hypothetical protein